MLYECLPVPDAFYQIFVALFSRSRYLFEETNDAIGENTVRKTQSDDLERLMIEFAQAEGARYIAENTRLQMDETAAIPKDIHIRMLAFIDRCFSDGTQTIDNNQVGAKHENRPVFSLPPSFDSIRQADKCMI